MNSDIHTLSMLALKTTIPSSQAGYMNCQRFADCTLWAQASLASCSPGPVALCRQHVSLPAPDPELLQLLYLGTRASIYLGEISQVKGTIRVGTGDQGELEQGSQWDAAGG